MTQRGFRSLPSLWVVLVVALFVALRLSSSWRARGRGTRRSTAGPTSECVAVDVAVFLDGKGTAGPKCSMILWLHVRYDRPAIAIVVVPPDVLVPGSSGSGRRLRSAIRGTVWPAAGTRAMGGHARVHVGGR